MYQFGWILIVIGLLFTVLGIGGSAVLKMKSLGGIVITAGGGIVLIIVGVIFMGSGL